MLRVHRKSGETDVYEEDLKRTMGRMSDRVYNDPIKEQMERQQALDDDVDLREFAFELAMRVSKLEQGSGGNSFWEAYDSGYHEGFSAGFAAALKQGIDDLSARLDDT